MTRDQPDADQVLQEYEMVRDPAGDPRQEAVKAAIFIEEVFGITLTDAEIEPEALGTLAAMRALIAGHRSPF